MTADVVNLSLLDHRHRLLTGQCSPGRSASFRSYAQAAPVGADRDPAIRRIPSVESIPWPRLGRDPDWVLIHNRTEYQPRPVPDPRSAGRKTPLTKSQPTPAPNRFRNQLNRAKLEIPIDHRRSPAGSCLGGFRMPDGIRKPSPQQTSAQLLPQSVERLHLSDEEAVLLRGWGAAAPRVGSVRLERSG